MKNAPFKALLLLSFLGKCTLASFIELNNDEVYYWTYAQLLQWNYFDHPPVIAVLIRLFTFNLWGSSEFFLRLGPIVCAAFSTWLIYNIGKKIKDEQTGVIAAFLFVASPYSSVIAGLLLLPDAPMMLFWLWAIFLMLKITGNGKSERKRRRDLLLLGVVIGLCIMSKVHGIFLWSGFLCYIVLYRRELLRNVFLYYAIFITGIIILPIFFWNLSNHFISYTYHSNRVSFFTQVQWDNFFREIAGEIMYNNPINLFLLITAVIALIRKRIFIQLQVQRLLLLLALPLIMVVLFIALFKDTLPHWSGPAYTTFIPFTAAWLRSKQEGFDKLKIPNVAKWAVALVTALLVFAIIAIKWLPLNSIEKSSQHLGKNDVTLDMNGWKTFRPEFDSLYHSDIKSGTIKSDPFLIADYWFPAAHIDYYIAQPEGLRFTAFGSYSDIHHYAWLNKARPSLQQGDDAYYIIISNYFNPPLQKITKHFAAVSEPTIIKQYRSGVAVRNFFIYRLKNYQGGLPLSGLLCN